MNDLLNISTTSVPKTYFINDPQDSFWVSMGYLLMHIAIAGRIKINFFFTLKNYPYTCFNDMCTVSDVSILLITPLLFETPFFK